MPAAEITAPGMPVEIAEIDCELKKLWQQTAESQTRASLINLAVYSEAPASLGKNTRIISEITENSACRAIVIAADPAADESEVQAWISAHCHVTQAGQKHVCSEQISFSIKGRSCGMLPNIVFAQLDSDLPLVLWWQEEFRAPMDPQLWAWVDRVIYDSQKWNNFSAQMRLVQTAQEEARQRIVLCDLNWMRLVQLRIALAQFFDHPATHHHLAEINRVQIEHASGFRSTALLLVGWLASQLHWEKSGDSSDSLGFRKNAENEVQKISVKLTEKAGEPISKAVVRSETAEFRVEHKASADLLELWFGRSGGRQMQQLLPAGKNDLVNLAKEELMRGGPHEIYLRAVEQVRDFL